jgi:hypothetical protein
MKAYSCRREFDVEIGLKDLEKLVSHGEIRGELRFRNGEEITDMTIILKYDPNAEDVNETHLPEDAEWGKWEKVQFTLNEDAIHSLKTPSDFHEGGYYGERTYASGRIDIHCRKS